MMLETSPPSSSSPRGRSRPRPRRPPRPPRRRQAPPRARPRRPRRSTTSSCLTLRGACSSAACTAAAAVGEWAIVYFDAADRADDRAAIQVVEAGAALAVLAGALGPAVFIGRHEPTFGGEWGMFLRSATCARGLSKAKLACRPCVPHRAVDRAGLRRLYRSRNRAAPRLQSRRALEPDRVPSEAAPCPPTPDRPLPPARSTGRVRVPGDKSISHRALMFGALATGDDAPQRPARGRGRASTPPRRCRRSARRSRRSATSGASRGRGVGGLRQPDGAARFRQLRHRHAADAGRHRRPRHDACSSMGDASLSRRPMGRVLEAVAADGPGGRGRPRPAAAHRARAAPASCRSSTQLPVPSAQVKSAMLLAGLHAAGETTVIETEATRDHTERMLRYFGAEVRSH